MCISRETEEIGRKRKHKSTNDEEHEEDYEKQPRLSQEKTDDQHVLLPIKSQKGFIQRLGNKPGMLDSVLVFARD
jgi:hypothetical protein